MTNDAPIALGPLFGPDFLLVTVNDDTKTPYTLEIYPDANNALLRANHLPQQYYFVPQRIYLAKKQDAPADFDFGMTVFKGLMTTEDTIGITAAQTSGGDVEAGGGFCTFSTTFAIPDTVIKNAITALKNGAFDKPAPARLGSYMTRGAGDPDPLLGIVPILDNDVSISIPQFGPGGNAAAPLWASAQNAKKGSLEATGISSFLVSCNQLAAGAIAGSLKAGVSPFMVNYQLSEQFYLPACEVDVTIDMDKVFSSFSASVALGAFFSSSSFSAAYSNCVTSGAIMTDMKINEAALPDDLKQMVLQQCQQMQQNAVNWVKDEIFDWKPTDGGDAQAKPGLLGSIFGGASVAMKATYQKRSIHVRQTLILDTTMAKTDTKSGDLTDLEPAIKANLNKYLAIVDIGEYFKKMQVAATNAINWSEKLPDGTNLADPVLSAMLEVSYPDYDQPLDAQGNPNFKTLGQGYHYVAGQGTAGTSGLSQWSANNPSDIINVSFLRLDQQLKQWPPDQVKIRKTLIFDGNDPRVDLTGNKTQVVIETTASDHTPVLDSNEVGYIFVHFTCRPLPPNVTVVVNTTLGARSDTITITSQNQKNALWEIFSDKYIGQTSFQYAVQVTVQGPDFTDNAIVYQSSKPITVPLQPGRVKYNPLLLLTLPDAPANQAAAINDYIKRYMQQPPAVAA
ncbi:MAG: hypothetical protein WBR11_01460 [Terriglobales bacterium]